MTNSVKTANDIRAYVSLLVDRLYETEEGIEFAKKVDIQTVIEELTRLSQEIVIDTVSDACTIESLY